MDKMTPIITIPYEEKFDMLMMLVESILGKESEQYESIMDGMNSKILADLEDAIDIGKIGKKSALGYLRSNLAMQVRFIRTMLSETIKNHVRKFLNGHRGEVAVESKLYSDLLWDMDVSLNEDIKKLFDDPRSMDWDEIRFCSQCGEPMEEGYLLYGGDSYYCSDECLFKNHTKDEWRAMYAGYDYLDPEDLELVRGMTDEQLSAEAADNMETTCYTQWQWED